MRKIKKLLKTILQIKKEQFETQRAIRFLIDCCLDEKGRQKISQSKPLVMHSLRVGFDLLKRGYDKDIVIGAILHDVEEDANVSIKEIERRFGKKISKIIEAVSFNSEIKNQKERDLNLYQKIAKAGYEAMIISVADHLDNADYYKYAKSKLTKEYVKEKWQIFLKIVASKISNEPIVEEFKKKMKNL